MDDINIAVSFPGKGLKWPSRCACCLADEETRVEMKHLRYEGHLQKVTTEFMPLCNRCAAHWRVTQRGTGAPGSLLFIIVVAAILLVSIAVGTQTAGLVGLVVFCALAGAAFWLYRTYDNQNEGEAKEMLTEQCVGTWIASLWDVAHGKGLTWEIFGFANEKFAREFSALNRGTRQKDQFFKTRLF